MQTTPPAVLNHSEHVRPIVWDLIWTLLTCGLYNLYIQYRQILALNQMLGAQKYDFVPWLLFTICTCGLYHIYHEYRMSEDIVKLFPSADKNLPILTVVVAGLGIPMVADAIQQTYINRFYGNEKV